MDAIVYLFSVYLGNDGKRLFNVTRPIKLANLKDFIIKQCENSNKGFIDEFRVSYIILWFFDKQSVTCNLTCIQFANNFKVKVFFKCRVASCMV